MNKDSSQYEDIMNLPHHVSPSRPRMTMAERAAQFSPFAALTGYDEAIRETGRLTEEKIDLEEDSLQELDRRFRLLAAHLHEEPEAVMTCFQRDARKAGGAYIQVCGRVRKVDEQERMLVLQDGTRILMEDILSLELTSLERQGKAFPKENHAKEKD